MVYSWFVPGKIKCLQILAKRFILISLMNHRSNFLADLCILLVFLAFKQVRIYKLPVEVNVEMLIHAIHFKMIFLNLCLLTEEKETFENAQAYFLDILAIAIHQLSLSF